MEPQAENRLPINRGSNSHLNHILLAGAILLSAGCRSNQSQTLPTQPPESCQVSVTAEDEEPQSVLICITYDNDGGILVTVPVYPNYPFILMLRKNVATPGEAPDYYYDSMTPGEKGIRFPPDVVNSGNLPTAIGITKAVPENPLSRDEITYVPFPIPLTGEDFTLTIPVSGYSLEEPVY